MARVRASSRPVRAGQGLLARPRDAVLDVGGEQIARVRRECLRLPQVNERLGHGSPCFYAGKKIFAMFSDNHHGDGRLSVWLKAPAGAQELLLETSPDEVFRPPYVGPYGWIGLHLKQFSDEALAHHVGIAYRAAASKKLLAQLHQKPTVLPAVPGAAGRLPSGPGPDIPVRA